MEERALNILKEGILDNLKMIQETEARINVIKGILPESFFEEAQLLQKRGF